MSMKEDPNNLEPRFCPTCGKPTKYLMNPEWLLGHFGGQTAVLLAELINARRSGRYMSNEQLVDKVFAVNDSAIPDPRTYMRAVVSRANKKIQEQGWRIAGPSDTGLGYMLVPLEYEQ